MTLLDKTIEEATAIAPDDFDCGDDTEVSCTFDLAGFTVDDETAFFHAVLVLDSKSGHELSRTEIMRRFGIHDRDHWHTVKESMYAELIRKHGSMDEVGNREIAWRIGQMRVA
jgi:hypothetical protein